MQKRSVTLMKKVDSNIESILTQFLKIIELSSILDKSQGTLAVEALQIESNSSTIVRMIEELLSITRNLKESWILGQIPSVEADEESYLEGLDVKMNKLLNLILEENEDDDIVTYGEEEEKEKEEAKIDDHEVGNTNLVVNEMKEEETKEVEVVTALDVPEVAKDAAGDETQVKAEKGKEDISDDKAVDETIQPDTTGGEVTNDD